MTRIPESGTYELVKERQESRFWELPEGTIILKASLGISECSTLVYLKPVEGEKQ